MADGGNVTLHEIDGLVVKLMLQGACGSCPSSTMTMTMGIKRKLMERIPEVIDVEQVTDGDAGLLQLSKENVEKASSLEHPLSSFCSVHFTAPSAQTIESFDFDN